MGFTANSSGIRKILLILLVLFMAGGLGYCAESRAADDSGLAVGFGKAAIGSEVCFDSLLVSQELDSGRWLAALATHGAGKCRAQGVRANMGAALLRATHLGRWAIGVGAGLWEHGDRAVGPATKPDRPQLCAHLLIRRYFFGGRAVLDTLHCSTGGATRYNPGLNLITFGMRIR